MLVAIIGSGPSGCALAGFLAQRGVECLIFDNDKRPTLLVGESLVPAAIPYLQRLGIEDEVAAISIKKRGAALRHPSGKRIDFKFRRLENGVPDYAYNIPRPEFDDILSRRVQSLGVRYVKGNAIVEKSHSPDRDLDLSHATLELADLNQQPDLLIDATGRNRLFSRILSLESKKGGRDDVAYFAHYNNFDGDAVVDGQVVLSIIEPGWSWQIPLKECMSVGVVINRKKARSYGTNPEERLEKIISSDPVLRKNGLARTRCSEVMSYSNYQLVTKKGYGKGWALLGDAYGFVDPMLSPGVFMAMESAALLERFAFDKKSNAISYTGLQTYSEELNDWLSSWSTIINYFYDGRLLGLFEAGENVTQHASKLSPTRLIKGHIDKMITSMVSGAATRSRYNQNALLYSCRHLLSDDIDTRPYAIASKPWSTKLNGGDFFQD